MDYNPAGMWNFLNVHMGHTVLACAPSVAAWSISNPSAGFRPSRPALPRPDRKFPALRRPTTTINRQLRDFGTPQGRHRTPSAFVVEQKCRIVHRGDVRQKRLLLRVERRRQRNSSRFVVQSNTWLPAHTPSCHHPAAPGRCAHLPRFPLWSLQTMLTM